MSTLDFHSIQSPGGCREQSRQQTAPGAAALARLCCDLNLESQTGRLEVFEDILVRPQSS